uniref:Uncharacterized protein n=1 Tax=viral metagenome TaxID=1070528 RepID=A0A6M3X6C4_9ZZZZ
MLYRLSSNSEMATLWLEKTRKNSIFTIKKGELEFDSRNSLAVAIALWYEGFVESDFRIESGG